MPWITSDRLDRLPDNWDEIRSKVLARDRHKCQAKGEGCQVEATEVDHVVRGDNHDLSNLRAICERCHARKSAKEGNEAKARLKALRRRPPERHPGLRQQ